MINQFNQSAIYTASQCMQLYKYVYVDKLESGEPLSADIEFGSAIHLGIENMFKGNDYEIAFLSFWTNSQTKDLKYGRFCWDELKDQGLKLLTRFDRLHRHKFMPIHIEEKITIKEGDLEIYGTPDLVCMYQDQATVLDFKTSGFRYPKEKIDCALQLYVYSKLVNLMYNANVSQIGYVVFVKGPEPSIQTPLTKEVNKKEIDFHYNQFIMKCKEIQKANLETRNYASCIKGNFVCPYFKHCYGKEPKSG